MVTSLFGSGQSAPATSSALIAYTHGGTNASTRDVQTKLRETVSVKDYGAVGDGVTNDSAAIQAAINAGAGGEVQFPEGTYYCATTITLSAQPETKLVGLGKPTIKFLDSAGVGFSVANGSQKVTFEHLYIRGTEVTTPTITLISFLSLSSYCTVQRCDFAYAYIAINMNNVYIMKCIGNIYSNCNTYVKMVGGSLTDHLLLGETYGTTYMGTEACLWLAGPQVRVEGCYFETESRGKHSIDIVSPAQKAIITGNQFSSSGGIQIATSNAVIVTNNQFQETYSTLTSATVRLQGGSDAVISNNQATYIVEPVGVSFLSASGQAAVIGNTISNYETGLRLTAGSLVGNYVVNCTTGILLGGSTTTTCVANYLSGNTTDISIGGGPHIVALNYATVVTETANNGTTFGNGVAQKYLRNTNKGITGSRPTLTANMAGVMYFDTTLDADGKPIWWTGTAWVDATGLVV